MQANPFAPKNASNWSVTIIHFRHVPDVRGGGSVTPSEVCRRRAAAKIKAAQDGGPATGMNLYQRA